jgi:hypothetical protein
MTANSRNKRDAILRLFSEIPSEYREYSAMILIAEIALITGDTLNHATGILENTKAELREYKVKEGLAQKTFEVLSN